MEEKQRSNIALRVLHIGKYFPPHYGGIETFMSQLMAEQAQSGMDVSAIVHQDASSFSQFEQQWHGCKIFNVKSYGQLVYAPLAPYFPCGFIRAIKKTQPDIIHIHMPNLSAFWLLLIKPFIGKKSKLIIHWHSDVIGDNPNWKVRLFYPPYRLFERWLLSISNSIICTSPNYLNSSKPLKKFKHKCHVIPLGIKPPDDLHQHVLQNGNVTVDSEDSLRLICIGRLTYYKGHTLLLEAIKRLNQQGNNVSLDIIGEGERYAELDKTIRRNHLVGQITLHGKVSDAQKNALLRKADMLCLPSIERTEAFGMVILEAACFSKPALVSDVEGSGMSYVVQDGKTGLVVNVNSTDDLVEKLHWARNNKQLLVTMGQNANVRAQTGFTIEQVAGKTTDLYRQLFKNA